jgi:hypothetical protein
MPKALWCACAALLAFAVAPAGARPQPSFDGRWVADLDSQTGLARDVYLVANGTYRCDSCSPPRAYPADGRPHPVPGDPEVTSESVAITGPRTMVTHIDGPSLRRVTTMTVAHDGATATYVSIDRRPGVNGILRTVYLARRIAPAPPGAHAVSGTWQGVRYVSVPEQVRTVELSSNGMFVTYRHPLGYRFTARLGGGMVLVEGPYRTPVYAALTLLDSRRLEERRFADGGNRLALVRTYTLARDGRTMTIATTDPKTGLTFRITARRRGPAAH